MSGKKRIFISSVQKELAAERRALKDYIQGDPLLGRFFDVFLFEDLPASGRRADEVYLKEVDRCDVYLGLFGNEYGYEDAKGVSPTEREFDRATAAGKERLIFVKGDNDSARHPKMQALVRKAGSQLIRRRFAEIADLTRCGLRQPGGLLGNAWAPSRTGRSTHQPAPVQRLMTLTDVPLPTSLPAPVRSGSFRWRHGRPMANVLAHLHMLVGRSAQERCRAALRPRSRNDFVSSAEVRCMHFHGTEIQRPAALLPDFQGSALRAGGPGGGLRALRAQPQRRHPRREQRRLPVAYEIPPDVVREAIVNAVAHRDYALAGAVQVSVFADRVEVWNPGVLPPPLTLQRLREPHGSVARNAGICEALFLARYIEKYGTGTLMMIVARASSTRYPSPTSSSVPVSLQLRSGATGSRSKS